MAKRKRTAQDTSEGLGTTYQYPSDFIDEIEDSPHGLDSSAAEGLRENRDQAVLRDAEFRRQHVRFDHAEELVDRKSTDENEEGIPSRNRIRRIVEDLLSVVLPNVPDATLRADAPVDPRIDSDEERRLRREYVEKTEDIANKAVSSLFKRSNWSAEEADIIYDAVVDGVGYAHPHIEPLASRRRQPRLDSLLMTDSSEWGLEEIEKFRRLVRQPHTEHVEAREVFWREGVRSVKHEDMTRVSRARARDVQWLRDYYEDPDIQPGHQKRYLYLDYDEEAREDLPNQAGYVETWQIEEFISKEQDKFLMAPGLPAEEAQWQVQYEDAIMVYTVITTNKLLEYHVFTPREAPMELPMIPYYVKTSKNHPYGFSVPLMLELQQRFANRLRSVMINQAMNSISPNTFAVMLEALGGRDREEIERAAEEGGFAWLEGNDTSDITDIIQQFPAREQGVNNAIANVVKNEERAMDREGQALSPSMLSSSRSASGKTALQNAADRPKKYSILNITEGVEAHHERMYQLLQRQVGTEEMLMPIPGGDSVVLNKDEQRPVVETTASGLPMKDPSFETEENPAGVVWRSKTFRKGDLTVPMHAQADTRGMWPTGLRAKLQLASAMAEAGVLTSQKTVREIVLDDRTRIRDDMNSRREEGQQPQQEQILQALQSAREGQMMQSMGTAQGGGAPQQGSAQQGSAQQGSVQGTENPALAGAAQNGMKQTRPGGGAGPREDQVGQGRRGRNAEAARQELEGQ